MIVPSVGIHRSNLFAILDLPSGAFIGTGVKTVVLFFEKGKPTTKIWYYQLNVGRNMGKTNPLNENDLIEFVQTTKTQQLRKNSWFLELEKINKDTLDLKVRNPNNVDEVDTRTPKEIILEIEELDAQTSRALQKIKELV